MFGPQHRCGDPARKAGLAYAAIFGGPGAVQSFSALWFYAQGFAPAQISAIVGAGLCARILFSLALGRWVLRFSSLDGPLAILCLGVAAGAACLGVTHGFRGQTVGWCVLSVCLGSCTPLLDAANLTTARGSGFYAARTGGAFAYLCGSLAFGLIASIQGISRTLPVWGVLSALAASLSIMLIGRQKRARTDKPGDAHPGADAGPAATGSPAGRRGFGLACLALTSAGFVQASHSLNALVMLVWRDRGYDPALCAALWQAGVVCDVALLLALARYPVRPERLLVAGCAAAAIRWAGFAMSPPLGVLLVLQALHALSATGTYVATVQLADRLLPGQRRVVTQLLAWAVMSGLAKGLFTLRVGTLYETAGIEGFWLMAGLALVSLMLAVILAACLNRRRSVLP